MWKTGGSRKRYQLAAAAGTDAGTDAGAGDAAGAAGAAETVLPLESRESVR